jgi:DNA repair photolyase
MPYIYEPKGKAFEYGALALNLYTGCSHGCAYCYVPIATRVSQYDFRQPVPRPIAVKILDREIEKHAFLSIPLPSVFLCFTCDPYQHLDQDLRITRAIIEKLNRSGLGVNILTKAGHRSVCDFDLLAEWPDRNSYGATLTFFKDTFSRIWEPGAALPAERLAALEEAHARRIPTWASLEPVIDPEQTLELIRLAAPYVDVFKVGKWNHDHPSRRPPSTTWSADKIDWTAFARDAVALLESLGKKYYIKEDLRFYLEARKEAQNE